MPNASTETMAATGTDVAEPQADIVMASSSEAGTAAADVRVEENAASADEVMPSAQQAEVKRRANDKDDESELCALMRTVQTQHGDYRTVDEENIVVLTRCWTPELSDEQLTAEAIWVQADALGRDAEEVSATSNLFIDLLIGNIRRTIGTHA